MKIKLPNSVELFYRKIGHGEPLLLLHGNGDSHKDLETLGKTLANNYTVYLIDSRGHGKSSHQDEHLTYEDLAEDIDFFIQELQLEKVNIIGHSDGAIIAALLAIDQKPYLRKIVLLGLTLKPELMKEKWTDWIRVEYEKHKHPLFRLMMEEPQIELHQLQTIEIPALVVAAEDDVMDTEVYVKISEHIPRSDLYFVENEDHMSYVNHTDKFATKALSFLNQPVIRVSGEHSEKNS